VDRKYKTRNLEEKEKTHEMARNLENCYQAILSSYEQKIASIEPIPFQVVGDPKKIYPCTWEDDAFIIKMRVYLLKRANSKENEWLTGTTEEKLNAMKKLPLSIVSGLLQMDLYEISEENKKLQNLLLEKMKAELTLPNLFKEPQKMDIYQD